MDVRTPEWPPVGDRQARMLERDEPEMLRSRSCFRHSRSCLQGPSGGRAVAGVTTQPFPGEERAVGAQQQHVSRRIAPIRPICALRLHAPRRVERRSAAHSPIWGNCVLEADPRVAQPVDDQLRAAHGIVSGAGPLHILVRGLDAQPKDPGDRLETCAAAFSRERPGHARWPPGLARHAPGWLSKSRFSRPGAVIPAPDELSPAKRHGKTAATNSLGGRMKARRLTWRISRRMLIDDQAEKQE